MNSALPIMNRLQMASPCDADWEEMAGDDRRRHCGQCDKFVYNLPLLDPDELVDLIESTEGKFCGRLWSRSDGTVLTDDCPTGAARRLARARRRGIGVAAAAAALMVGASAALFGVGWGGCEVDVIPPAGGISVIEEVPEVPVLGQAVMVEPVEVEPVEVEPPQQPPELIPTRPQPLGRIKMRTPRDLRE